MHPQSVESAASLGILVSMLVGPYFCGISWHFMYCIYENGGANCQPCLPGDKCWQSVLPDHCILCITLLQAGFTGHMKIHTTILDNNRWWTRDISCRTMHSSSTTWWPCFRAQGHIDWPEWIRWIQWYHYGLPAGMASNWKSMIGCDWLNLFERLKSDSAAQWSKTKSSTKIEKALEMWSGRR